MRKNKTIKVYESDSCYDIPGKADEFMAFWQRKIDKIPAEFKESARIEIEAVSFYDSALLEVEISYTRPETDVEMSVREQEEINRKQAVESEKLKKYNKLKKELNL